MKNVIKSLMVVVLTFVVGYIYPITSYASFVTPSNLYRGTYYHLTKDISFVKINSEDVSVVVVYSPDKNVYASATNGWGSIANDRFEALFSKYVLKNSSGTTIRVVNSPISFYGDVEKASKYIDIIIGGIIYEKTL